MAVGLYVLDKYNTRAAEEYLAQRCRITGRSLVDSCHKVESWFLAAPEEGLETLSYPVTPSQKRCQNSIHKFLAEFRAVQFVRECNFQKGHAPAYAEVVETYVQSLRDMGSSELLRLWLLPWTRRLGRLAAGPKTGDGDGNYLDAP